MLCYITPEEEGKSYNFEDNKQIFGYNLVSKLSIWETFTSENKCVTKLKDLREDTRSLK